MTITSGTASYAPVGGGHGVVDGQLERADLVQAARSHVGEEQPVSHAELRQQAALHHVVQLVQRGTPQAAGIHRLLRTQRMLCGGKRTEKRQNLRGGEAKTSGFYRAGLPTLCTDGAAMEFPSSLQLNGP